MLSEEVIKELISTPAFLNNASKLAYMLHMSQKDASQELLLELLEHRLRLWSNKDVTMAIAKESPSLRWKVKYATKDYYRRVNKDAARELTKSQMMAGMEPQASNEDETLEALKQLPELFKNASTRTWCGSILRFGRMETMIQFHQSPRQFGNKLNKVCKYARQHRQPKQSNSHAKELHTLSEWNDLMADPDTDDNCIQAFINSHQDYINEVIINSPLVKYQGRVLKDFSHAGRDKYVFANLMAKREQELKENK
ncbi:hypothetical protein ABUE37_08120 [Lacticaseibacillus paracasei]|uniref:hypothetical protein n=1 Tax=Lacticaseibacillus paracasei TaxID=1597 RepID=UPI003CFCCA0B